MRKEITNLFLDVARHYMDKGLIDEFSLYQSHDVHAFYRLSHNPDNVIHIQGYPGMSYDDKVRVNARLMDYKKMTEIRNRESVTIGNEHNAVIKRFSHFEDGINIHCDTVVLEDMLAENIPELKK